MPHHQHIIDTVNMTSRNGTKINRRITETIRMATHATFNNKADVAAMEVRIMTVAIFTNTETATCREKTSEMTCRTDEEKAGGRMGGSPLQSQQLFSIISLECIEGLLIG